MARKRTGLVVGGTPGGLVSLLVNLPTNSVVPAITGTATQGNTLSASAGTWAGTPTSYTYQWRRDSVDITGATSASYVLVLDDVGHLITVATGATNASGPSASLAVSAATSTVAALSGTATPITLGLSSPHLALSSGDLAFTNDWAYQSGAISSATLQGKCRFQLQVSKIPASVGIGYGGVDLSGVGNSANSIGLIVGGGAANGNIFDSGAFSRAMVTTSIADGVYVDVYVDVPLRKVYFLIANSGAVLFGDPTFDPAAGTGGITIPGTGDIYAYVAGEESNANVVVGTVNFGATAFTYTTASGFSSVSSTSAVTATVSQAYPVVRPTAFDDTGFFTATAPATYNGAPGAINYYIDPTSGSDANNGTSSSTPWRTMGKISNTDFPIGTVIAIKKGTTHTATGSSDRLQITCNGTALAPIYITAYGTGAKPILIAENADYGVPITIGTYAGARTASYVFIDGLDLRGQRVGSGATIGNEAGIKINDNSHHIWVYNCNIGSVGAGLILTGGVHDCKIMYNYIHDGVMTVSDVGGDNDYGANGVILGGASTATSTIEIAYNSFYNLKAASLDYTYDGGVLELYNKVSNVNFHHNYINISQGFCESGGSAGSGNSSNISIHNNIIKNCIVTSMFHNAGNFNGIFTNITFTNNTVYNNVAAYDGSPVAMFSTDVAPLASNVLATYNIFHVSAGPLSFFGGLDSSVWPATTHHDNVFCRGGTASSSLPINRGASGSPDSGLGVGDSIVTDVLFTNAASNDFSLQTGSPAAGKGAYAV